MYFCTDTGNIYIDYKDGSTVLRKLINKDSLDKKLNLTGGTISGKLTFSGTSADTANLAFSREGYNYITFPSGGNLALATSASGDGIVVGISNAGMYPYSNNTKTLGTSDKKWSNVYATTFTGALSGNASTATALTSKSIGSATNPVYFDANGKPVATTYTLGKSVPSDAKFTDTTYSNMTAATSSAAGKAGLVPAPAAGKQASFLRGDGTWVVPTNTTYSNFVKSGSGAKAGLVPAPSTTAGTTKYLREDGTWAVPPDNNTTYSNFVKSGSGAAAGLVPAPSTTAGTTKYLREDGTWAVPPDNDTTYTLSSFGITATAAELNKLDGVTASTTEINKLKGLTATTTELNYVDGVTSAIQTQLNGKQASITGAATTIASSNLTASRALISNSSGKVAVSAVTSTELGYLDGVTSAIQTQLNGKVAKAGDTMTGQLKIHCSNPYLELKDSSYDTIWYIQAYQDTITFGPTYASAVKTDKNGNMTAPGTVRGSTFKCDSTEVAIKPSDSNEVNFGSNASYIYFGYENRVGSSGKIDTYKFGTHSGAGGATNGNIECGTVKIGSSKLVYDSTNECLNFTF